MICAQIISITIGSSTFSYDRQDKRSKKIDDKVTILCIKEYYEKNIMAGEISSYITALFVTTSLST